MRLLINALVKFIAGFVMIGLLLFLPAWTLDYPNAWLFICLLFIPVAIMGVVLYLKAPDLLEKRLNSREKETTQKGVIAASGLMFLLGFVISALDFRFAWSHVPFWCVVVAAELFLLGYAGFAEVMRENAYLSRAIEVQKGQKVIDKGLYGVVRHPMYLATLLMFLPMPIILGSFWGLLIFAAYPAVIVLRILNEEEVLTRELEGYKEYKERVKWRILPFIW